MDPRWTALMKWCEQNPYSTIERLEIVGGKPNLIVVAQKLSPATVAFVKIKYKNDEQVFTQK